MTIRSFSYGGGVQSTAALAREVQATARRTAEG